MNSRQCYELQNYLYRNQAEAENPNDFAEIGKIWDDWHCMILIEANQAFFDKDYDVMKDEIRRELNKDVTYLNLNVRQSIVLFKEEKCDYFYVANHIYTFLKLRYPTRFHLAISERFTGHECLPEVLRELEKWTESKFYHIEDHVLSSEEEELAATGKEVMDHRLIEKISHDMSRKDSETMWKHYRRLEAKYEDGSLFSAVYVKFVFSNVVEALYQDPDFSKERDLLSEVAEIYTSRNAEEVLKVTKRNIEEYTKYADEVAQKHEKKIHDVEGYILKHSEEDMNAVSLSEQFDIIPGYLMFQFRVATGKNLYRYIHELRMKVARKLLTEEKMEWRETVRRVGYTSTGSFVRMYYQYYGETPEQTLRNCK